MNTIGKRMRKWVKTAGGFLLLAGWLIAACSQARSQPDAVSASRLAEFQRTQYCVYGGLPMELRFDIVGSPPRIGYHTNFGSAEAEMLQQALDPRLLALMKTAVIDALEKQSAHDELNYKNLSLDFEAALINHAGRALNLSFCGDEKLVGSTVEAALTGWFSRAVDHASETDPLTRWFVRFGAKSRTHETEFIMLATALHAARPDIGIARLARAFRSYVAFPTAR